MCATSLLLILWFNPNQSLDRICFVLLLPVCFPTAFVRLPTSALPLHLAVARYAFDETSAHLFNNLTKLVKDSNEPIWALGNVMEEMGGTAIK